MNKKRFNRIYIEILNRCNLRCSFCPPDCRPARMLSTSEFEHIAKSIAPFTSYICLHVKGEPLMHPELAEILAIAARWHLQVNLTTNAVLLPQKGELLLGSDAPRQISLSLHSFEANVMHDSDFASYLQNAVTFAKQFTQKTKGYISFRLWNLANDTDADQRARNQFILETLEQAYALTEPIDSYVGKVHGNALAARTFLNFDPLFDWPNLASPDYGCDGTCHGLRRQLAILSDGTVVPCCLDQDGITNLGNIFTEPLDIILEKKRSLQIIEDFQNHHINEPLCRHCGYRTRFS